MKIVGKYKLVYGEKMCGVYKITNPVGRIYVGSSKDIKGRYHCHKSSSKKDKAILYDSIREFGLGNHVFEVIELCNTDDLFERERYWQERYNVIGEQGLNWFLQPTANKVREYRQGFGEMRSSVLKICLGGNASEKMTEMGKKRKFSKEQYVKTSNALKGRKLSQEIRDKIRAGKLGKVQKTKVILNGCIIYNSIKDAAFYNNLKCYDVQNNIRGISRTTKVGVFEYYNCR